MQTGFWREIKKPILASASMANVTDVAFREMLVRCGKFTRQNGERVRGPDVIWTEFVSCDGLCSRGKEKLLRDLIYTNEQRPIVVQFFGATPENFYKSALLARELGFDGIDINMGCPDKSVERQGAGAALIKNPKLALKIIKETKRGAGGLPVSVKTRLGYNENILDSWLPTLLETNLSVITIHCRTRKEKSTPPAHWEEIKRAVEINIKYDSSPDRTLILGNGDIKSLADAKEKIKNSGADGAMIGRALIGNPWFFNEEKQFKTLEPKEKMKFAFEHAVLFEKYFGKKFANKKAAKLDSGNMINFLHEKNNFENHAEKVEEILAPFIFSERKIAFSPPGKSFDNMKKHFVAYACGFNKSKKLKLALMSAKNAKDAKSIVDKFFE